MSENKERWNYRYGQLKPVAKNACLNFFKEEPGARSHAAVVVDRPDSHHRAALRKRQLQRAKDLSENLTATTSADDYIQLPDERIDLEEVESEILRQGFENMAGIKRVPPQYLNVTRIVVVTT